MKITFYGGVNEIGGNKILLEDKKTRIFLDFGKSYKEASKYFEEFVAPRAVHGIKDYLELDLIPKEEGIYRKDLIEILKEEKINFFDYQNPLIDGVLLSHAHLDHAGYISFLDENIPIICSEKTKIVLDVLNTIKPSILENEIVEIVFPRNKPQKERKRKPRNFKIIAPFKTFQIKDLQITAIPADHSVLGAVMFLIKGTKTILYSGDFRLSEISQNQLKEIYDFLKKQKIDYFLSEGTRILEKETFREIDVYEKVKKIASKVQGLLAADYSLNDVTRFQTLCKISKETKRKFALPFNYFAFVTMLKERGVEISNSDNIVLYEKKKGSLQKWEKELLEKYPCVNSEEISKNKNKYFVILNYYQIQELIDLQPDENSYFLRAITEPHSEEMEFSEERFINWIKHFKMQGLTENGKFERAHISGHISGRELEEFIKNIKPGCIIPIHTEHPEEFKNLHKNVNLVKKGETIEL